MFRLLLLVLFLHCFFLASYSQDELALNTLSSGQNTDTIGEKNTSDVQNVGVLYRYEMSGGVLAHSNGFGVNFRKGKHLTGYKKRMLEIELVNMKHPKEHKSFNPSNEAKGYIFGKQNTLAILRTGIGIQKVITSKQNKGGVELRYLYYGGASIGFLKPVYLEILKENKFNPADIDIVREKYDPQKHNTGNIYGKAPYTKGITEMRLLPGIYGKFGLSFEYGVLDDKIRAIETGVTIDLYYKKVPIMADINPVDGYDPNRQFFLSFYISILYGNKW